MALINCPDCNTQVSENASHCLKCGSPITAAYEKRATGADIITTQTTAKRFKAYTIIAAILFWFGLFGNFSVATGGTEPTLFYSYMIMIGALLYIVTKIRIYWHHN